MKLSGGVVYLEWGTNRERGVGGIRDFPYAAVWVRRQWGGAMG